MWFIFLILGVGCGSVVYLVNAKEGIVLEKKGNLLTIFLVIITIGFISITSLPNNYMEQRATILVFILAGVFGCMYKLLDKKSNLCPRLLVSASVVASYLIFLLS